MGDPIYSAPKTGVILAYNVLTAHKALFQTSCVTSGGGAGCKWALGISASDSSPRLLHWIASSNSWNMFETFIYGSETQLSLNFISIGEHGEFWAISTTGGLYRYVTKAKKMEDGIYISFWEEIETKGKKFSNIAVGSLNHVWAISNDKERKKQTVLFELKVLKPAKGPVNGLLRDYGSYSWNMVVVDKDLKKLDVNASGELWGISRAGKLYHRVPLSNSSVLVASLLNSYEPEESSEKSESFYLLPGEKMDNSIWRRVNPFKYSISSNDHENVCKQVCVGKKTVWCLDTSGRLYLQNGTKIFRRVIVADEKITFDKAVSTASHGNIHAPYVVSPNAFCKAFAQSPDSFSKISLRHMDVSDDDILNMVTNDGLHWCRLRPQKLTVITANSFKKIWDDANAGCPEIVGIWRANPLPEYHCLGDFAERSHLPFPLTHNFESPNEYVFCVKEDREQYTSLPIEDMGFEKAPHLLTMPSKYTPLWHSSSNERNSSFGAATLWRAVPPSPEYASLGCIATPSASENQKLTTQFSMCVHKSLLLSGSLYVHKGAIQSGAVWQSKSQPPASIWEITGLEDAGISSGSFQVFGGKSVKKAADEEVFVLNLSPATLTVDSAQ